ncbi:hypothetical protein SAMN04487946_101327 [Halobellus clavatus]|jgi:hypothetical protein|uniref:Uncharacterized protein n=1 Tax=Halobellus clavatus TaxID=660517 RepID=A0A1H3D244_9EURY|nr:hypothetical protein SAMN04487946_101327 [Halobellus clavatus]
MIRCVPPAAVRQGELTAGASPEQTVAPNQTGFNRRCRNDGKVDIYGDATPIQYVLPEL